MYSQNPNSWRACSHSQCFTMHSVCHTNALLKSDNEVLVLVGSTFTNSTSQITSNHIRNTFKLLTNSNSFNTNLIIFCMQTCLLIWAFFVSIIGKRAPPVFTSYKFIQVTQINNVDKLKSTRICISSSDVCNRCTAKLQDFHPLALGMWIHGISRSWTENSWDLFDSWMALLTAVSKYHSVMWTLVGCFRIPEPESELARSLVTINAHSNAQQL